MRRPGLALALALLAGLNAAHAGVHLREVRCLARCLPGQELVFIHRYGTMRVYAAEDSVVRLSAQIRVTSGDDARARQFARLITVDQAAFPDSLVFTTVYPRVDAPDSELSFEVRLSVGVPAAARVRADNAFGDIYCTELRGGCEVSNRYGSVELSRCGRCRVRNQYGDVRLDETDGPVAVENSYGNVVTRETRDSVDVDNRYGAVQAEGSIGEMDINNIFGNVTVRRPHGRLSVDSRYGDVAAWVGDSNLTALEVAAQLGLVELYLAQGMPFRLDGTLHNGTVRSGLPLVVREVEDGRSVSGALGRGGPLIQVMNLMGDMVVRQDSQAGRQSEKGATR